VTEVKGYPEARGDVDRVLQAEMGLVPDDAGPLHLALAAIDVRAGTYSSKLALELDPRCRAEAATRQILRALLNTMVANEEGTSADLDPEFLHDFRVAVRRTRTALAQLKEVFPPDVAARYRAEFAWLGELTGPARDLDVYLIRMRELETEFAPDVIGDLDPLVRFLTGEKNAAYERLIAGLRSQRYWDLIDAWPKFLDRGDEPPLASLPIEVVAGERIRARFERALSRGQKLHAGSPPGRLHRLRIDCKKLRYLLEFFRSLYPAPDTSDLIRELKHLQDNLGEINDLHIQGTNLIEFGRRMLDERNATAGTLVAMGRLIERLQARRAAELARFEECFAGFASPENRQRMARILPPTGPGVT
jgi:CHAD domain-containing protein